MGAPVDSGPQMLLAASSETPGWRAAAVDLTVAGDAFRVRAPGRKSVLGRVLGVLGTGEPTAVDELSSLEMVLIDEQQWLTSANDQALAGGANLALIGREAIQFGEAIAVGPGRFRLRRLLRGRLGTEAAIDSHGEGEMFVLANADQLRVISLPAVSAGVEVVARPAVGAATRAIVREPQPRTAAMPAA